MFLVFAYDAYYPDGGWRDLKGKFDSEAEALILKTALLKESDQDYGRGRFDYVDIVDITKSEVTNYMVTGSYTTKF